jgi:KDO2-lipid IV(A) lauroyltransferase
VDLTVAGFKAGSRVAAVVPPSVSGAAARALGAALARLERNKRTVVARNLSRVLGPDTSPRTLAGAVDAAFENYALYYLESLRLPGLSADAVNAGFTVDGYEHLTTALAAGNGAMLVLPHLGGWEWAGRWVADQGHPITVVVEPIEPPELFEWFVEMRSALGMTVVPLGPHAGAAVARALRANEVVCLLADRDVAGGGVPVTFFGEKTTMPAGPATLTLRTAAPILPTAVYFAPGRDQHLGIVRPRVEIERTGRLRDDVALLTQRLAEEFEFLIRKAPAQWHLFQPNWPSDPGYRH